MAKYLRGLREDFWAVLQVEVLEVPGGKQRPIVLIWAGQHGGNKSSCTRPGNHVEVVYESRILTIQLLQ